MSTDMIWQELLSQNLTFKTNEYSHQFNSKEELDEYIHPKIKTKQAVDRVKKMLHSVLQTKAQLLAACEDVYSGASSDGM